MCMNLRVSNIFQEKNNAVSDLLTDKNFCPSKEVKKLNGIIALLGRTGWWGV